MDTTSTLMVPDHKKSKQMIFVLLAIIVVLSISYIIMVRQDKIEPYSIEARYLELLRLKNTSEPVSTVEERYEAISNSEGSGTVQVSTFEKLKAMDALNQK